VDHADEHAGEQAADERARKSGNLVHLIAPGDARGRERVESKAVALGGCHAVAIPFGHQLDAAAAVPGNAAHVEVEPIRFALAFRYCGGHHEGGASRAAAEMLLAAELVAARGVAAALATAGDRARALDVAAAAGLGGDGSPEMAFACRCKDL